MAAREARAARELARALAPETVLPQSDGLTAGALAALLDAPRAAA